MANEMPHSSEYTGLSRKVLEYSEGFANIVKALQKGPVSDADWAEFETVVDVENFERQGVFLTAKAEICGWKQYKDTISKYAGSTSWEGTLRHITESPGRVILELEERNTRDGITDYSNTVTIYEFNQANQVRHLEVYVMPLSPR
jgi:hypothetical protein